MKAVDLHIHTKSTISDANFTFSMESLKKYISDMDLDIIAITNHNEFDKEQFKGIQSEINITVLPGIEINLEGGHLLLITRENDIDDFSEKCNMIKDLIKDKKDNITVEQLKGIFLDLNSYLLIPHQPKKPKIGKNTLDKLEGYIDSIEVGSIKDFLREYKHNDKYTPLWFSDYRASYEKHINNRRGRTYLNIEDSDLTSIKIAFKDKSKVSLTESEGNSLFPIDNGGFTISTGLNVVIGARSSGKTYLLDNIYSNNEGVKYIRQFSLLEKRGEGEENEFVNRLKNEYSLHSEEFLADFNDVVKEMLKIDIKSIEVDIERYLDSLIKFAEEENRRDIFSNARLYTATKYEIIDTGEIDELIKSVEKLLENESNKDLIEKFLTRKSLVQLILELAKKGMKQKKENELKKITNDLVESIKDELQTKTVSTEILDVNFINYIEAKNKIEKFNFICELVQKERIHELEELQKYKVVMNTGSFTNASDIRSSLKTSVAFSEAYKRYDCGYDYLQELKKLNIEMVEFHKYFCKVKYDVHNEFDLPISGGERAEYNLLHEIKSANTENILLIDEPESSFDNPFLMKEVNDLIKNLSRKMPVVVVTHNNTVALSINPDYIIHTFRDTEKTPPKFKIYRGTLDKKELINFYDESDYKETSSILLNSLEAGETAYVKRSEYYGLHENR